MENQNIKLQQFRNFADQIVSMSMNNKKQGISKKGELSIDQSDNLFESYLNLTGLNKDDCCEVECKIIMSRFNKSESGNNISLNEQKDILEAASRNLGISSDEVDKVLNEIDEKLFKMDYPEACNLGKLKGHGKIIRQDIYGCDYEDGTTEGIELMSGKRFIKHPTQNSGSILTWFQNLFM